MMQTILLLSAFGEWIEANIPFLFGAFVVIAGILGAFWKLQGDVRGVADTVDDIDERVKRIDARFIDHEKNTDVHVSARFYNELSGTLTRIENKIDALKDRNERNDKR